MNSRFICEVSIIYYKVNLEIKILKVFFFFYWCLVNNFFFLFEIFFKNDLILILKSCFYFEINVEKY